MYADLSPTNEDGTIEWKDDMTPSYYQPLTKESNKEPHQFIRYWQLEIQLLKTIGLGALLDNPEDEESQQPPYTLSAAASLDVKNNEIPTSKLAVRLTILKKEVEEGEDEIALVIPKVSKKLEDNDCFHLVDSSIFVSFLMLVRELDHFNEFKATVNVSDPEGDCPSIECIRKGIHVQCINQMMSEDRLGDSIMGKLERHPLVMLMSMVAWNESMCCVPLQDLPKGFIDFFEIFSLEVRRCYNQIEIIFNI